MPPVPRSDESEPQIVDGQEVRLEQMKAAIQSARQVGVTATASELDNNAGPIRLILEQRFPEHNRYDYIYDWADLLRELIGQIQNVGRVETSLYREAVLLHYGFTDDGELSADSHSARQLAAAVKAKRRISMWKKHDQPRTDQELARLLLDYHDPWEPLPTFRSDPTAWIEAAYRRTYRLGMRAATAFMAEPLRPLIPDAKEEDLIDYRVLDLVLEELVSWFEIYQAQPTWDTVTLDHTELPLAKIPMLMEEILALSPVADVDLPPDLGTRTLSEFRKAIPASFFTESGLRHRVHTLAAHALLLSRKLGEYVEADIATIKEEEQTALADMPDSVIDCYRHLPNFPAEVWERFKALSHSTPTDQPDVTKLLAD